MKLRAMVGAASVGLLAFGLSIAVVQPAHADTTAPGSYNPATPVRVLDTRSGLGAPVAPLASLTFAIPASVSPSIGEILLEVTVVRPTASGYATVYAAGSKRSEVSNINFQVGQTVPNMVVVKVGAGNKVTIFNGSRGTINLLADVNGYFRAGANAGDPGTLVPLTPTRFLDTRSGLGAPKRKVAALSVTRVQIAGRGGVPADASAVAVNLAAVRVSAGGFLTAYPGSPRPDVSTVNFDALQNRANLALVELDSQGAISIFNGSPKPVDLLADVNGYFVGGGTPAVNGAFVPSSSVRALDTRKVKDGALPGLATLKFHIFPPGDPYNMYIQSVAINVTAVKPFAAGFLTTWDGRTQAPPAVSNVNFLAGGATAGSIVVPLDDGAISIYNGSPGNLDLLIDFDGLFFQLPDPTIARNQPDGVRVPTAAQLLSHVIHHSTAPLVISRGR